jgi:membrane protease YdiL (CAAX protease family)
MEYSPFPEEIRRNPWIDRLIALLEVLLMSGLLSGFLAAVPFSVFQIGNMALLLKDAKFISIYLLLESCITFLILAVILRAHRETIASLGLRWKNWSRNFALGLALVPFLFLIDAIVALAFKLYLPKYYMEQNPLTEMIRTPQQLALFILAALLAGGIKEELQRAFILNRFRSYLGGSAVGLVLWSVAFGAGHYIQGAQGIVIAVFYGFIFGIAYILSGSLIAPMIAHGLYDSLVLLAYWFFSRPAH